MDTNQITQFDFRGATVRVLTDKQGEPWFVGKDVAKVLGYSDANKAVAMHVDNEDKKLNDKTSSSLGYPHMSPSSISSHSSRGSVYALGVTTCSCCFVLGSSSSTISQPRRASPLGVMPIMSA